MSMGTAEMFDEIEEREHARLLKERDELLDRKETFQLKMLNMKLDALNKLSESISSLATSMAKSQSGPTINFYIENMTADQLKEIKDQVGVYNISN